MRDRGDEGSCSCRPLAKQPGRPISQTCRNRRFRYLRELEGAGEYFSDHAMRERAPQLYHHFIGRFAQEEKTVFSEASPPLSLRPSHSPPPLPNLSTSLAAPSLQLSLPLVKDCGAECEILVASQPKSQPEPESEPIFIKPNPRTTTTPNLNPSPNPDCRIDYDTPTAPRTCTTWPVAALPSPPLPPPLFPYS